MMTIYGGCDEFKLQSSKTQWLALADNTFFSETLTTFFYESNPGSKHLLLAFCFVGVGRYKCKVVVDLKPVVDFAVSRGSF